jgi:hypothetical protein
VEEVNMTEPSNAKSHHHPDQQFIEQPETGNEGSLRERIREGVTMALYISLSLMAVMVARPANTESGDAENPARLLIVTSIGLIFAHAVAFRMSTRLANKGQFSIENIGLLIAQIVGGLAVTIVAATPLLLIGGADGVVVSELVLLTLIALVGYVSARSIPVSRLRAVVYVMFINVVVLIVIWVKNLAHH